MTHLVLQSQLLDLHARQAQIATLRRQLTKLEAAMALDEATVVGQLERGVPVEPGVWLVRLERRCRRTPHWKEAFAKACGPDAVERVIAETPPRESVELVVERRP